MQVAQVKPGVDQQALIDMARHMGMRVGYQGGFQILYTTRQTSKVTPIKPGGKAHE